MSEQSIEQGGKSVEFRCEVSKELLRHLGAEVAKKQLVEEFSDLLDAVFDGVSEVISEDMGDGIAVNVSVYSTNLPPETI